MKRIVAAFLLTAVLLSGCALPGRSYVRVTPHNERTEGNTSGSVPAESFSQLLGALRNMVASGVESDVIYTLKMEPDVLEQNMGVAVRYIQNDDAIGAYAVESITYEIGTTGGKTAVAVSIAYRHGGIELRKILHLENMEQAEKAITESLEDCRSGVVMLITHYDDLDVAQLVQNLARRNPQTIMEIPEVAEAVYGTLDARVLELSFQYQNSRDSLRQMQAQVRPVFDSAALYVSGEGADIQKYSQLYAFLMERFDYTLGTSITPTYSLLRHGVGDSRAFATVYAAMCTRAGLECVTVTGTRNGEPWTWNIVRDDGFYYHVDLLASNELGMFREMWDSEMSDYVWDYSAYPECKALLDETE